MAKLLVVDDEQNIRELLARFLASCDHEVQIAASASQAFDAIRAGAVFDIILTDWLMAEMDGLQLLEAIKSKTPEAIVILMTAYGSIENAVRAMKAGAFDYLTKPLKLADVQFSVERALEFSRLRSQNRALQDVIAETPKLTSGSRAFQQLIENAHKAALSDSTILLTGESGTGKNVLARQIHDWSSRNQYPFVTINCTTISEELVESELFGHMAGSFTGATKNKRGRVETADHGTVFLDEISEIPLGLQAKLLRFLAEGRFERVGGVETLQVDVRMIAASNRDLPAEVQEGRFRPDLYYRLNVINLRVPPLRERPEDIMSIAEQFLAEASIRNRRDKSQFSDEVVRAFLLYRWPGNIRELRNVVERAVILSREPIIKIEDLPDSMFDPELSRAERFPSLERMEQDHIKRVLLYAHTFEEAAQLLGITPATLWRKRKLYNLN